MLIFLLALPVYLLLILPPYLLICLIVSMIYLNSKYPDLRKLTDKECVYTIFNVTFWPLTLLCSIIRGLRKFVIYFVKNAKSFLIGFFSGVSGISWDFFRFSWVYIKDTINWTFRT